MDCIEYEFSLLCFRIIAMKLTVPYDQMDGYGHSDDKPFDDYGYGVMQLFQSAGGMEEQAK